MSRLIFILGGTKTGKTGFAQKLGTDAQKASGKNVSYIATAKALDEGMEDRIKRHRQSRPSEWLTFEEPLVPSSIIEKAAAGASAVILDCFTMLATNIIMQLGEDPDRQKSQNAVTAEIENIIGACGSSDPDSQLIIISNQVESGLVAPTYLGGLFQDISGICHQMIAAAADEVYLMTAGIPQRLK